MNEILQLRNFLDDEQREQVQTVLSAETTFISCMFWRTDGLVTPPRSLRESLILFAVQGRAWCRIGDAEATIGPGEFMMVPDGVEHESRIAKRCRLILNCAIHAHLYTARGRPLLEIFASPFGKLARPEEWFQRLRLLSHLSAHDQKSAQRFGEPMLRELLVQQILLGNPLKSVLGRGDMRAWIATERILRAFSEPITVADLAREVGLSEVRFRKIFAAHMGMTPRAYIRQIRVRNARALLLSDPELTVKEVASRTGFGDPHYLHAVFKEFYGETPGECRSGGGSRGSEETADERR